MVISVNGKYDSEDEALVGLLCLSAAEKYDKRIAVVTSQCMLTRYDKNKVASSFISDPLELASEYDVLFDFTHKLTYEKQLIIRDHTLGDFYELKKLELKDDDVILLKNYVPVYKSEKTLFGPNELKNSFKNKVKVFAIELDIKIQNSIYLGVMENGSLPYRNSQSSAVKKIFVSLFMTLTKEAS